MLLHLQAKPATSQAKLAKHFGSAESAGLAFGSPSLVSDVSMFSSYIKYPACS